MTDFLYSHKDLKNYLDRRFAREDSLLHAIRLESKKKELPPIQIPIYLGKFLYLLALIQNAKNILEIGTLGGYSTVCLARALSPDGKLISLELNPFHVQVAQEHINQALLSHCVEIRQGYAIDLLSELALEKRDPFDFVFIDADKENNVLYLEWALSLARPGALILIDNIIPRTGKVGYPANLEAKHIYAFNDYLANHASLETVVIPTLIDPIGQLDGLAITRVRSK